MRRLDARHASRVVCLSTRDSSPETRFRVAGLDEIKRWVLGSGLDAREGIK